MQLWQEDFLCGKFLKSVRNDNFVNRPKIPGSASIPGAVSSAMLLWYVFVLLPSFLNTATDSFQYNLNILTLIPEMLLVLIKEYH